MTIHRGLLALSPFIIAFAAAACAAPASNDDNASDETTAAVVSSDPLDVHHVTAAIAKLQHQRTSEPIGAYYENGARLEGCWRNPAGSKLTDLKKAFYCSMPLEFRLCNTIVLLTVDESKVEERYQGYLDCQKKVDRVFGDKGLFVYSADINAMYQQLFLKGMTLSTADTDNVVLANKPAFSSRSFPGVVLAIGVTLTKEAVELSIDGLTSMVDDYKAAENDDPR